MPTLACPDRALLTAYMFARLPAGEREEIDSHVESCSTCQSQLETITASSDTLASALRHANDSPAEPDSQAPEVIARIEALGRDPSFAGKPGGPSAGSAAELGVIRDYQLLAKLGEGGMGAVYKALHLRLDKVVALKVLPEDRLSPEAVARFQREMKAVGKLDHPHIVRAMDAGEHAGRHFLVMEHVEGIDLGKLARRRAPLAVADACEIVRQAALGLQHAHEHGLVHRDIKPSNIMLTVGHVSNVPCQVKILDLGLALLNGNTNGGAPRDVTSTGQVMGTLDYMAPEQADDSHQVDIRADLYSLGATLYKLLTGQVPLAAGPQDSPLKRLLALATQPPVPITNYRSDLPASVTELLGRLLAKNPADRPATPGELAAALAPLSAGSDLAALADSLARDDAAPAATPNGNTDAIRSSALVDTDVSETAPPSATAFAATPAPAPRPAADRGGGRWNPWLIALAAGAAGILLVLGAWLIIRDRDGKEIGRIQIPDDAKIAKEKDGKETPLVPATPDEVKPKPMPAGPITPVPPLGPAPVAPKTTPDPLPPLAGTEPLSPLAIVPRPAKLPGVRSWSLETVGHRGKVVNVVFSPNGYLLASVGEDRTIRIWDVKKGKLMQTLVGAARSGTADEGNSSDVYRDGSSGAIYLTWSPDGSLLASISRHADLQIWEVDSGKLIKEIQTPGAADSIRWSPSGGHLLIGGQSNAAWIYEVKSGNLKRALPAVQSHMMLALAWSPTGDRVVRGTWSAPAHVYISDAETGKELHHYELEAPIAALLWSADGKSVVATTQQGLVQIRVADGTVTTISPASGNDIFVRATTIQWAGDGQLAELNSKERPQAMLRAAAKNSVPKPIRFNREFDRHTNCGAWSPDGNWIANGRHDGMIQIWRVTNEEAQEEHVLGGNGRHGNVATWSPDGTQLVTATGEYSSGTCWTWDISKGVLRSPGAINIYGRGTAAQSNDNRWAAANSHERFILLDNETQAKVREFNPPDTGYIRDIKWSPNGQLLALGTANGGRANLHIYDSEARELRKSFKGFSPGNSVAFAWSPDSMRIAAFGDQDNKIKIVNLALDKPVFELPRFGTALIWSPNSQRLAVGRADGGVEVWSMKPGEEEKLDTLKVARNTWARPVAWLEKDNLLVTMGGDNMLRYWNTAGDEVKQVKLADTGFLSPDLKYMASSGPGNGWTNMFHLWHVASGRPQGTIVLLRDGHAAVVSPDGHVSAPSAIRGEFVVSVEKEDGSRVLLSRADFETQFGWKNDPAKATLIYDRE